MPARAAAVAILRCPLQALRLSTRRLSCGPVMHRGHSTVKLCWRSCRQGLQVWGWWLGSDSHAAGTSRHHPDLRRACTQPCRRRRTRPGEKVKLCEKLQLRLRSAAAPQAEVKRASGSWPAGFPQTAYFPYFASASICDGLGMGDEAEPVSCMCCDESLPMVASMITMC